MRYFENIGCKDVEFYRCICKLATLYLAEFDKTGNIEYVKHAKPIGVILYTNRWAYSTDKKTKIEATKVNGRLRTIKL